MADEHAKWTQEAIAILSANVAGGIEAGAQVVGNYLGEQTDDWHELALKATTLLTGMANAAFILLTLLEQSTERSRIELLQDLARVAESFRAG